MIHAGHRFERGDGSGYVLKRDVHIGDMLSAADFEPFGGAEPMLAGEMVPAWLATKLEAILL